MQRIYAALRGIQDQRKFSTEPGAAATTQSTLDVSADLQSREAEQTSGQPSELNLIRLIYVVVPDLSVGPIPTSLDVVPFQNSAPMECSVYDSGNNSGSPNVDATDLSRGPSEGASCIMPLKMIADFIPHFDGKPGWVLV